MSANNKKKEFEKRKKEGIKLNPPHKSIPFKMLQDQFKVLAQKKGDLSKERQNLIAQLNENDKFLFECQSQMSLLTQLMNPKIPKKEVKK